MSSLIELLYGEDSFVVVVVNIYLLAASRPNCSTQDLCCIMQDLLLWCTDSSCGTWAPKLWRAGSVAPGHMGS